MASSVAADAATTAPPRGLVNRMIGVVVSPRETFESVVAHPRWAATLVLLAVVAVLMAASMGAFLSTEVGREAWLEQAVRGAESWGRSVNDKQYQAMEKMAPYVGAITAVQIAILSPIMSLLMAGMLFGVFKVLTGSPARFQQTLAVLVHASPIALVHQALALPLNYVRGTMSGSTSLAVFAPMLEPESFGARLLGALDPFVAWWLVVLSIGLSVLYRRRTGNIAAALMALYLALAVAIAALMGGHAS